MVFDWFMKSRLKPPGNEVVSPSFENLPVTRSVLISSKNVAQFPFREVIRIFSQVAQKRHGREGVEKDLRSRTAEIRYTY